MSRQRGKIRSILLGMALMMASCARPMDYAGDWVAVLRSPDRSRVGDARITLELKQDGSFSLVPFSVFGRWQPDSSGVWLRPTMKNDAFDIATTNSITGDQVSPPAHFDLEPRSGRLAWHMEGAPTLEFTRVSKKRPASSDPNPNG